MPVFFSDRIDQQYGTLAICTILNLIKNSDTPSPLPPCMEVEVPSRRKSGIRTRKYCKYFRISFERNRGHVWPSFCTVSRLIY